MCLAVPTLITAIEDQVARIEIAGVERAVSLVLTPEAKVGDYALIHSGYAIGILAPEEAEETLRLLREMEDAADAEDANTRVSGEEGNLPGVGDGTA